MRLVLKARVVETLEAGHQLVRRPFHACALCHGLFDVGDLVATFPTTEDRELHAHARCVPREA